MIPLFGSVGTPSEKVTVEIRKKSGEILRSIAARRGVNLWVLLRRFGVPVGASCSGVGVCGKCAVRALDSDEHALTIKTDFEKQTLVRQGLADDSRLSCLCRVNGNVSITADYW